MATTKFTVPDTEISLEVDNDSLKVLTKINFSTFGRIKEAAQEYFPANDYNATMMLFRELVTIGEVTYECLIFDNDDVSIGDWDQLKEEHVYSKSEE